MTVRSRYRLLESLGQGGVGTVFKAVDRLTGQFVALKQVKVITPALTPAAAREGATGGSTGSQNLALAFEFRTLAGLRHPNIVSVLDYGLDTNRQPFFTMQLISGAQPITSYGAAQDVAGKVRVLCEMLDALAYLHRREIIHRDVKPSNILITDGGVTKVMDFGMALNRSSAVGTAAEGLSGTLAYMAPELFDGKEPTVQSDLYSAGIIAYELFTGHHPFAGENTASTLQNVLHAVPDTRQLPPVLAGVLLRLLSKRPAERYASAPEVIEALCRATGQPLPVESLPVRESYLQASEFVGRQAELSTLLAALGAILEPTPQGGAWLVGGESGVGKSRLMDELRIRAMIRGALVLRGQAVAEGSLFYQVWRDPLRRLVLSIEVSDTEAATLKQLVPDISDLLERDIPAPVALDSKESGERLIGTIVSLLSRIQVPTVLILEDLQWAPESLDLLKRVIAVVQDLPLLLVGNYRDEETPDLPAALPGVQTLKLERLNDSAIEQLCTSMLGEAGKRRDLIDLLRRETEGNAYFIVEAVRMLSEEAGRLADIGRGMLPARVYPGGIKEVLQRRLKRVPEWGQAALRAAAVAGRELNLDVLGRLLSHDEAWMEGWLTRCLNAAVLEIRDGRWRFAHDKLREAVLAGISEEERAALHRRVAEVIEQIYADDETWTLVLMEHWRQAGDDAREMHHATQAVGQLVAISDMQRAYAIANRILPKATDTRTRAMLLRYVGLSEFRFGNMAQAWKILNESLQLAREAGDRSIEARCLSTIGNVAARQGNLGESRWYYDQSLAIARELNDWPLISINLEQIGDVAGFQSDFATARRYYDQSLAISRQFNDRRGIAGAYGGLGWVASGMSDYAASISYYSQSYAIAEEIGDRATAAAALGNLGALASAQGDYATAIRYYEQQLQIHEQTGLTAGTSWSLWALARVLMFQGDFAAATEYNRQSLAIHRKLGARAYIVANLRVEGELAFFRGQFADALQYQSDGLVLAREMGSRLGITAGLIFLGQVRTAQGELEAARADFGEALDLTREYNFKDGIADSLSGLGWLDVLHGEYGRARSLLEEAAAASGAINYKIGMITSELRLGILAELEGAVETAIEINRAMLEQAQSLGLKIHAAASAMALGFALLAHNDPQAAMRHLVNALRTADDAGAEPLVAEALIGIAACLLEQGRMQFGANLAALLRHHLPLAADTAILRLQPLQARLAASGVMPDPDEEPESLASAIAFARRL